MSDVNDYLAALAEVNRLGFGFLLAYGLTWSLAGLLWWLSGERVGIFAALFQGMVALPVALGLTALVSTGTAPDDPLMTSLSIYLSIGQLLILPLAIVLIVRGRYTVAVAALAAITAVHFVPYSWLYQTPIYAVLGAVISAAVATFVGLTDRLRAPAGALICLSTGVTLLLGSALAYLLA